MRIDAYHKAVARDSTAAVGDLLPHDMRRDLFLRARPELAKLYETMRDNELGEVDGLSVSLAGFDRLRCIFVHVPKCAGTSIGRSLYGEYRGNHMGIATYQMIFSKEDFDSYFKFGFVRNPWDRVLSAYRFMTRGADATPDRPKKRTGRTGTLKSKQRGEVAQFDDFESFVLNWVNARNTRLYEHFRPQHRFVCTPRGRLALDYVARFETIDDDLAKIGERLGVDLTVDHLNKTRGEQSDYRSHYTPQMRRIVEKVYAKDIELFDYSFDAG